MIYSIQPAAGGWRPFNPGAFQAYINTMADKIQQSLVNNLMDASFNDQITKADYEAGMNASLANRLYFALKAGENQFGYTITRTVLK